MLINNDEYLDVLDHVKREIAATRHRTVIAVNSELLCMYWRIGKTVDSHTTWGNKFIETLSKDIRIAYPDIKGFSPRYLKYMVKFARENDFSIVQTLFAQLSWSHNIKLMDKVSIGDQRLWYAKQSIENGWSLAVLDHQIESKLYERQALAGKVSNFERTLPAPESDLAQQALKDPYIFDFITTRADSAERVSIAWRTFCRTASPTCFPQQRIWKSVSNLNSAATAAQLPLRSRLRSEYGESS